MKRCSDGCKYLKTCYEVEICTKKKIAIDNKGKFCKLFEKKWDIKDFFKLK